jgi:hypothetical protein
MTTRITHATPADARRLAAVLRETDRRELRVTNKEPFYVILENAIMVSTVALSGSYNGQVCALFGCAPIHGPHGSIWLLASEDIYKFRKEFMKLSRTYVEVFHNFYPLLGNWVDDRNRTSQAWLRRLGFKAVDHCKRGDDRTPFTYYLSERHNV